MSVNLWLAVALGSAFFLGRSVAAQSPFACRARGPFHVGEWIALELDARATRGVREIALRAVGREEPSTLCVLGPERSVAPPRFPLYLAEEGTYEVLLDGRVAQRLELDVRPGTTWPARTWVPEERESEPPSAWWELAAWNQAYAPADAGPAVRRAAELASRPRRLPATPIDLRDLRGRHFLAEPALGHALGGALLALALASLGLPRRVRAALVLGGATAAMAAQIAAPELFWPRADGAVIWTAWRTEDGSWRASADELRLGEGEVALEDELWLEPLAGGSLLGCRREGSRWVVRYRGGILRRWWPAPPATALESACREALAEGRPFRGARPRSESGARATGDLLHLLASRVAASGERSYAVWRGRPRHELPDVRDSIAMWCLALARAFAVESEALARERGPARASPLDSRWLRLSEPPHDPFGNPAAPRFLRVIEGP